MLEDSDAFGQSSAKVNDEAGDSLCCASVPEAVLGVPFRAAP